MSSFEKEQTKNQEYPSLPQVIQEQLIAQLPEDDKGVEVEIEKEKLGTLKIMKNESEVKKQEEQVKKQLANEKKEENKELSFEYKQKQLSSEKQEDDESYSIKQEKEEKTIQKENGKISSESNDSEDVFEESENNDFSEKEKSQSQSDVYEQDDSSNLFLSTTEKKERKKYFDEGNGDVQISGESDDSDSVIEDDEDIYKKADFSDKDIEGEPQIKYSKPHIHLREYQITLFQRSKDVNSIIYLPTGSGKTMVSIISMYYYLSKFGEKKKIVFLANTIQLVKQQVQSIRKYLERIMDDKKLAESLRGKEGRKATIHWTHDQIKNKVICIHGQKSDDLGVSKRKKIESQMSAKKQLLQQLKKSSIVVMISQIFLNCLRRGYIDLCDFSFMVFDQCHHCSGDHPYSGIMKEFYFDKKKEIRRNQDINDMKRERVPILMGLTASPVSQPSFDKNKIIREIRQLAFNLDSQYSFYEQDQNPRETDIQIVEVQEVGEENQFIPDLICQFEKFRDHKQSYERIKYHFPQYFKCVEDIVEYLSSNYQQLRIERQPNFNEEQLFLFYDIKECLLTKIRDLWLELGKYAFYLGFNNMILELKRIQVRNPRTQDILQETIKRLHNHALRFEKLYGKCKPENFSGKVNKLIDILASENQDHIEKSRIFKQQKTDMVLVFSAKRRTVKYLEEILQKYKDQQIDDEQQKKNFVCKSVTGYSTKSFANRNKDNHIYSADPSSSGFMTEVHRNFEAFREENKEEQKNQILKEKCGSQNLQSQMKRNNKSKFGNKLLEIEEKYANQIKKISEFRKKQFRILITTSVTEQGFDIPECNTVISFDIPHSLKSYIQIKGRARRENSKYFILANSKNKTQMKSSKQIYDETIKAIYQIAINQVGKQKFQHPKQYFPEKGYKKIKVKSGATLNTNYSLEVLKTYFSSLKAPNKPHFTFIETPNICYKCVIYFPETSYFSKKYVIGEAQKTKDMAAKSAAYIAVTYLLKEGFIKMDLRPKKYEQLEEERELENYNDIKEVRTNEIYRSIFEENVKILIDNQSKSDRKFLRFYFSSINSRQFDYAAINPQFKSIKEEFRKNEIKFTFQVYMMNLSNTQKMPELEKTNHSQQVGILTCFPKQDLCELFSNYQYYFEENQKEKFMLKQGREVTLDFRGYEDLQNIHDFLVTAASNREHQYYSQMTKVDPLKPGWLSVIQKHNQQFEKDKTRQFYPLLVLLQKEQDSNIYSIDDQTNKKILLHRNTFSEVYKFHNKGKSLAKDDKFWLNLKSKVNEMIHILSENNSYENKLLIQSIHRQFCFHKCLISKKIDYDLNRQSLKFHRKKNKASIQDRHRKFSKLFSHTEEKPTQLVTINLWRKYRKEKKNEFFRRCESSITFRQEETSPYYLLQQFIPYPINAYTLLKVSLAIEFLFKAYSEYMLAWKFRNIQLAKIFKMKLQQAKSVKPYSYKMYSSIILENQQKIFSYLKKNTGSHFLRELGKVYSEGSKFQSHDMSFLSSIKNNSIDQSNNISFNNDFSGINLLDKSDFNLSYQKDQSIVIPQREDYQGIKESCLGWCKIDINLILRVLTSKMYKFHREQNYEEFEFIGDVILKLLATIQVFLEKQKVDESQLHIGRANIICNANLHRKGIIQGFFKYILTKMQDCPVPPLMTPVHEQIDEPKYYSDTGIQIFNQVAALKGFRYIPGKVHADMVEALIGVFYLRQKQIQDCQALLYCLDILKKPNLNIKFIPYKSEKQIFLPSSFSKFEERINYHFKNKSLLVQTFTHSSFKNILHNQIQNNSYKDLIEKANKSDLSRMSFFSQKSNNDNVSKVINEETFYERLEFLGDAILDLLVVEYLYKNYDTPDEGTLTLLKQAGVSNKSLGLIAISLGMHQLILMDHPDSQKLVYEFRKINDSFKKYMQNPEKLITENISSSIKILGDVFEALVGSIFIDLEMNYEYTKQVVMAFSETFIRHFTQKENLNAKFHKYLEINNYRQCQVKKAPEEGIRDGMFKFILVDKLGNKVRQCWETNEKKAWDTITEQFYLE